MNTKLISVTGPNPEAIMAYCARVSSPRQDNPEYAKLFTYCIQNRHWSIFEMASLCVEITTSRAIAAQLLRHKSFSFQEFSQRYAEVESGFQITEARRQDRKNRQNSIDDMSPEDKAWFALAQEVNHRESSLLYKEALRRGIAKECARMLLPLSTTTRLYMHGSVRSWITYLETRLDKSTQLEHRQIAEEIRTIFVEQFPTIAAALKANQESSDK